MGFAINPHLLPGIYSYEQAVQFYDNARPFRHASGRALANARDTSKRIDKHNRTGAIVCTYYGTECVVFWPDGTLELRTGGYATRSTGNFISGITGYGCTLRHFALYVYIQGLPYAVPGSDPLLIRDGQYVSGALTTTRPVLNLKRAAQARREYALVFLTMKTLIALGYTQPTGSIAPAPYAQRDVRPPPRDMAEAAEWVRAHFGLSLHRSYAECAQHVRQLIYSASGCYDHKVYPPGEMP